MRYLFSSLLLIGVFLSIAAGGVEKISLMALFEGKAIVKIDGVRRVLVQDTASPEGVTLISTDTIAETAEIEIAGKRRVLRLGIVATAPQTTAKESVTLWAEPNGSFRVQGNINNVAVTFLVDTGADTIVINDATARRVGVDYKRFGKRGIAVTASGYTRMYNVKLESVEIGGITMYNVDAGVIEGAQPQMPLLGMSFLGRVDIKQEGDRMELIRRY